MVLCFIPKQLSEQNLNLINLHFLSSFQIKCLSAYDLFEIVVFVLTTRRAPVGSINWSFR